MSTYDITADALAAASRFVAAINEAVEATGVDFEPSFGGVSVGNMMVGHLRWSAEGFVLNVSHA